MRIFLILLLLSGPALADPLIRVALKVDAQSASVSGAGGLSVKPPDGSRVLAREAGSVSVGRGVSVNGTRYGSELLLVPRSGVVTVDGARYRGYLKVIDTGKGLTVVNLLPLETYIASVLGGEIDGSWPRETLRAHAIASRTYAYFMMEHPRDPLWDVAATVLDQVYRGASHEGWATRQAAQDTAGKVLANSSGEVLKSFYSSNCGGHTSDSEPVFDEPHPPLKGVADPFCAGAPNSRWTETFTASELRGALAKGGKPLGELAAVEVLDYDRSGRIATLVVRDVSGGERRLSGAELRKLLGARNLRGTRCKLTAVGSPLSRITLAGGGWGHGVGLCQWGALAMGEQGYSFREILDHYYPGSHLTTAE